MNRTLRFLPEVEEDAAAAAAWYETYAEGLGDRFLREFFEGVQKVGENPLLYREISGPIRRCLLRRFPYVVYFIVMRSEVVVLGLFHTSRDPQTTDTELQHRHDRVDD